MRTLASFPPGLLLLVHAAVGSEVTVRSMWGSRHHETAGLVAYGKIGYHNRTMFRSAIALRVAAGCADFVWPAGKDAAAFEGKTALIVNGDACEGSGNAIFDLLSFALHSSPAIIGVSTLVGDGVWPNYNLAAPAPMSVRMRDPERQPILMVRTTWASQIADELDILSTQGARTGRVARGAAQLWRPDS